MIFNLSSTFDITESFNDANYTKLYIQDAFCKNPKLKMYSFYFRPLNLDANSFYKNCITDSLIKLTLTQISLLEECCSSLRPQERRPFSVLFKVEERILQIIANDLISMIKRLSKLNISIILDLNINAMSINDKLNKTLYYIHDSGCLINISWGDWHQKQKIEIPCDVFNYIRIGPPPKLCVDVNKYIDTCFYIKEELGVELILDKIQSSTELDIACRTPYSFLMGEYISKVRLADL
ncbi:hypothetical protein [Aeromonas veronii]|uniref:hypothetical protein n=1 Tax=Aeromonas veronii TaxID=654 RepID=UPI001F0A51CA|nr:hypothetical protein [Aeromonas veronii]